jgi:hypothetical protein
VIASKERGHGQQAPVQDGDFHFLQLVFAIGAVAILVVVYRLASFVSFYFLQPPALQHYRTVGPEAVSAPYALITGSSAGIGFAFARELACTYKFNIIFARTQTVRTNGGRISHPHECSWLRRQNHCA